MLCRNPFIRDPSGKLLKRGPAGDFHDREMGLPFPCGQCLPCRINRRRVWTLRLMLEGLYHEKKSFVTLTYDDEHMPLSEHGLPVLNKREVQLWLKRLRKLFSDREIRYYLCGEYGKKGNRPHYHAILYGLSSDELDPDWVVWSGQSGPATHTRPARLSTPLYRTWSKGIVHVGECSRDSIQYVAGYVLKKIVKYDRRHGVVLPNTYADGTVEEYSDERVPEFSLMSRKPGIGSEAVEDVKKALLSYNSVDKFRRTLRLDSKEWPIGRYLLDKLQQELGREFDTSDYVAALTADLVTSEKSGRDFLEFLVEKDAGRAALLDAKQRIYSRGEL